jgi:hypothetical protein
MKLWVMLTVAVGLVWNVLATPINLTVTSYGGLVRFQVGGMIQTFRVKIFSLAGQTLFDSGFIPATALDWHLNDLRGHPVANGLYLYSVATRDASGKLTHRMGKLALLHGQSPFAPIFMTTPNVGEVIKRVSPSSSFDGAGNLLMENDQVCLGNACNAGGRIYDQTANSRTVFQGLGNKISYVSEDGTKVLIQLQTLVLNGRDTALLAGGISGTKNIALLGDTGGNGDVLMNYYAASGNVGIGTASPFAKLHVVGAGQMGVLAQIDTPSIVGYSIGIRGHVTNAVTGAMSAGTEGVNDSASGYGVAGYHQGGGIGVYGSAAAGGAGVRGDSTSGTGLDARSASGTYIIEGWDAGSVNRRFAVVRSTGNVLADGAFTGPADFAEMMKVSGSKTQYEPGDVLVIGPDGDLTKSSKTYATNLAGVYSTRPGFVGDTEIAQVGIETYEKRTEKARVPVAILGIVPVKVTSENGPIQPGDMLTSSSAPGHAMKAQPITINGMMIYPTGTILGKALQSWEKGAGVIQVLVTLR